MALLSSSTMKHIISVDQQTNNTNAGDHFAYAHKEKIGEGGS
jgi:hypothetical protein